MPASKGRTGARYGTRDVILSVLSTPEAANGLLTRQLVEKVRAEVGEKIAYQTIFQATKVPVREGQITRTKVGREYSFALTRGPDASSETTPATASVVEGLPHRLDPGQVLVLRHDADSIVTVSNVHGLVKIEKHKIE